MRISGLLARGSNHAGRRYLCKGSGGVCIRIKDGTGSGSITIRRSRDRMG